MFTTTQILILCIVGILFVYAVIDRICKCVELVKSPLASLENLLDRLTNTKDENGNKSI